ncbi:Neurexin-3a-beta [Labeo rohita]|uniref:Neurexin-3a-beta n=1 Tax=Labeo rohita TaxID=84645 RepID=A0ABQ8LX52_LABRO|nr:Neurexin-3a-beta [Labeo rohita]
MANKKIPFKYARPVEEWLQEKGRQLTIFNTQATITIGGSDRKRPFQGQLSGLYYNGLKVLNMAAQGNPNIKINGSVRLVGGSSLRRFSQNHGSPSGDVHHLYRDHHHHVHHHHEKTPTHNTGTN